jgi:hypothetical protein
MSPAARWVNGAKNSEERHEERVAKWKGFPN